MIQLFLFKNDHLIVHNFLFAARCTTESIFQKMLPKVMLKVIFGAENHDRVSGGH